MRNAGALASIVAGALAFPVFALGAPHGSTSPAPAALRGVGVSEYAARRAAAMATLPDGLVVLRGSVEEEFGEVGRFRQNNWFMYLTGCEVPGALLLLDPFAAAGEREVLYLPPRDPSQERWTGEQIGAGNDAVRRYAIRSVRDANLCGRDVREALERDAKPGKRLAIYTIAPSGAEGRYSRDGAFADYLRQSVPAKLASQCPVDDASHALGELRRTKSPAELDRLGRAIAITLEAERDVARTLEPGKMEYEVESVILAAFVRNGSQRPGFPSIVGSGVYSTVLHYDQNSKRIDPGDLVVVDIGAEYDFYTADITRTWPASGRYTPRQREVYQLVLDAQEAAARGYASGMTMRDLHEIAVETMRKSSLRGAKGNTLDTDFIHGLGHFLGMDVHDVGDYTTPLKPGDVITIEPGIYLADERLGVRIEDDYLVTDTGLVKLSKDLPSTPDEIERMLAAR